MTEKKVRADRGNPPLPPDAEPSSKSDVESAGPEARPKDIEREERKKMPSYGMRTESQQDGVTVSGEALRRTLPERAEFLVEVTATAGSVAQALRDSQMKATQISQAIAPLGVQPTDVQTISLQVHNMYTPVVPALPGYAGVPQIGAAGFSPYAGGLGVQPDVQLGSYCARNIVRINVREPGRAGEVADTASRAGAAVIGGIHFRPVDETNARRTVLEAAAKDARQKAEALAAAAGKQLGDPIAITEEILASNGTYTALRAATTLPLTTGLTEFTGELEYYARISATYRIQ